MAVGFTPSQLSNTAASSPITYRESPFLLFWSDICLVFRLLRYAIQIILPFRTDNKNGELAFTAGNIKSMVLHFILFICSAFGLVFAPLIFLCFPGISFVFFVLAVTVVCAIWIRMLNWGKALVDSDPKILQQDLNDYPFPKEKWYFINGVMVGTFWLESAINEISRLFERKVTGIRNLTWGVLFDLVECLIQRDLGYTTRDVREAYKALKESLLDPNLDKVVVVAHSQGGIVLSMALDNLLSDLPREYFRKLEIYTFGCAANHFNNPKYQVTLPDATVPYIEHYANTLDFVSRFGVLNFVSPSSADSEVMNRFSGRVFERVHHGGHMFVQHYLTNMFGKDKAEFLEQEIDASLEGGNRRALKPELAEAHKGIVKTVEGRRRTVGEVSRLVKYLGGGRPKDLETTTKSKVSVLAEVWERNGVNGR